jgi:hypothetical protein
MAEADVFAAPLGVNRAAVLVHHEYKQIGYGKPQNNPWQLGGFGALFILRCKVWEAGFGKFGHLGACVMVAAPICPRFPK